jgi:hypothetical protein
MQRFTQFQTLVFGSMGLGRVVRMALSAVTVQAVMQASAFGQQAGDDPSTPASQPVAAGSSTPFPLSFSPGVCTSAGAGGLRSVQGCVTSDGYNPARMIYNRSTPEGGWAVYGLRDSQGNPTVCAGPSEGVQWGMFGASVTPSACVTYRRDSSPTPTAGPSTPVAPASPDGAGGAQLDRARQDAYQAYQQMLNQVRNDPNVYNNPFASNGGSPSNMARADQPVPMPPVPNPPLDATGYGSGGMNPDQFRASVNQSMQQFRQADSQFRQGQASQSSPAMPGGQPSGGQLVFDENAPRNPGVSQNSQVYAPRNGYDAQGYRTDSSRNQYDAQGYRTDSPRNGYDAQGIRTDSSRNRYDAQGYRTDSPRNQYDAQGYRTDSSRPQYDAQGYRTESNRPASAPVQGNVTGFTYNPNGPRSAVSGAQGQSSPAPVIPTVSRRAIGTQSQTAALEFPGE